MAKRGYPGRTVYCEAGHNFKGTAQVRKFLDTKSCFVCGRPPKQQVGIVCAKCKGPVEESRPNSAKCRACNKGKTQPIMPMKPNKKCWIVKKGPGHTGKISTAESTPYYSREQAGQVASGLASRERSLFIVFEAVEQFDVAPAISVPFEEEEHPLPVDCDIDDCGTCKKEPWHEVDTTCEDANCSVCCNETGCGKCDYCVEFKKRHPEIYKS